MQHTGNANTILKSCLLILGVFCLTIFAGMPSEPGLEKPEPIEPYLNGVFPPQTPGSSQGEGTGPWIAVDAYPNLTFIDPIAMVETPDKAGFFVGSKNGFIYRVSKESETATKIVVLDIADRTTTGGDAGLINFVLHPEFGRSDSPNRGFAYVMYRHHDTKREDCGSGVDRLSRFTFRERTGVFDPTTEEILMQQYSESCVHMGGGMFFGNDGYLYFTVGDGGGGGGRYRLAQTLTRGLFAGLFRIDVDRDESRSHPIRRQPEDFSPNGEPGFRSFTQGYYIPNDNPWQGPGGNVMEEYYAMGLRSPHRATFDAVKEEIWIGDVGELTREEVVIARKGYNYQWPYREGTLPGRTAKPSSVIGKEEGPFFDYGRSEGNCVIGGFVYRGQKWQEALEGKYLFGDHLTRNVWSIDRNTKEVTYLANIPASGPGSKNGIASFATDSEGNIYVLKVYATNRDGGQIYKLDREGGSTIADPPRFLSETGAFDNLDELIPAPGLIPYRVNTPLWSDGAVKKRWIALPNDGMHNTSTEEIAFSENESWQFPEGTVFVKHFELPADALHPSRAVRLETRFLVMSENGGAYGLTYRWNEEGTDAELLPGSAVRTLTTIRPDGNEAVLDWQFPSRTQCMTCHTPAANFVLGVNTPQLNCTMTYPATGITDNQLHTWNTLGMFTTDISEPIASLPRMASLESADATLEHKVSSYLAANCAHCHRPGGVEGAFDARYSVPMEQKNIIGTEGTSRNTPAGAILVVRGDVANSELYRRDAELGTGAMPPLGKTVNDDPYLDILAQWINSLKSEEEPTDPIDPVMDEPAEEEPAEDPMSQDPTEEEKSEDSPPDVPDIPAGAIDIWLEAECGDLGAAWEVMAEPAASGEQYIIIPNQNIKFINNPSDDVRFTATYRFLTSEAGVYKVFLRTIAPNTADDSFWVRVNDVRWIRFNGIAQSEQLNWDQVHDNTKGNKAVYFEAVEGENVLQLSLREDGTAVDKIFITKSGEQPDGEGGLVETCEFPTHQGQVRYAPGIAQQRVLPGHAPKSLSFEVYPNPFSGRFNVLVPRPEGDWKRASLRLFDAFGRLIRQRFDLPFEEVTTIDGLGGFEAGVYYVRVQAGEESGVVRIVKQ